VGEDLMTARELARYLHLNEKKIYALVKRRDFPCTKRTGKWLFSRKLVDRWIEQGMLSRCAPEKITDITIAGSHDLAIDLLASELSDRFPQLILLSAHIGSLAGLETLRQGRTHVAGIHLLDPDTGEYNLPFLHRHSPDFKTVVVHLFGREQGLILSSENPSGILGIEDLNKPGVRLVNRQEGSGTRLLLDQLLQKKAIAPGHIQGYDHCVATHTEVATTIRHGLADVGLGLRAAALAAGLDFILLKKEQFDLVMPKMLFYTEPVQELLDTARSPRFKERVRQLGGYDVHDSGSVIAWN
jgi:putative molybdopterin biosynthesis protein